MMIRRISSFAPLAICLASCTPAAKQPPAAGGAAVAETPPVPAPPRAKPKFGTFGVELDGRDATVRPGDDFYRHAGGRWLKESKIPADRVSWGASDVLAEEAEVNVRALIEELANAKPAPGTNAQKAAEFYATYVDRAAIDQKGFAPAKVALDAIAAAKTLDDICKLMARPDLPSNGPIAAGVSLDQKDPDHYVVIVLQSGLGLPEREFYLKKEQQFQELRTKYQAHIAKVLAMVGDKRSTENAKAILDLETRIAEHHWPIAERRQRDKTYNPRTLAELRKEAPAFPWKAYFEGLGYAGESKFVVRENTAIPKLAELFAATPVATWKAYLTYHFLRSSADVLPSALDQEVFDFVGRVLRGQPEQRVRWKRAVAATNEALGEAVGELYVARFFQPRAKTAMDALVDNLRKAYAVRIQGLDWMTAETKKAALEKLAAFRPKIGYPSKWKDYAKLDVALGDAFGNAKRAAVWEHEYTRAKLGKPTDRDEWFMPPQEVNAYYNATFNEIVFPAAILQPPYFDPDADPAVNYGAIGGVIGHEMGHGFDDQGSKSDAKGVLRNWWSPTDLEAFKKRTEALADQYGAFEPLPGLKVNGKLTLGENIGDIGGLTVAYEAYRLSLQGAEAQVIDSFSGPQRFFLGWAQAWRELQRDEALRNQVMANPHSPAMYRVNGVVRNMDAWYAAFDVKERDALYLAPEKRVKIW